MLQITSGNSQYLIIIFKFLYIFCKFPDNCSSIVEVIVIFHIIYTIIVDYYFRYYKYLVAYFVFGDCLDFRNSVYIYLDPNVRWAWCMFSIRGFSRDCFFCLACSRLRLFLTLFFRCPFHLWIFMLVAVCGFYTLFLISFRVSRNSLKSP